MTLIPEEIQDYLFILSNKISAMLLEGLLEKVKTNAFTIGIVGIGRVGLPLGLVFANSGIKVIGIDVNKEYVESINKKIPPFKEELIDDYIKTNNFTATTDIKDAISKSDVLILTVGTPIGEHMRPDYTQLTAALEGLVKNPLKGKMLIMRSTASPGTLEEVIQPFIEKKTGLKAGEDFGLAVCPERIVEGHSIKEIKELPEIIGSLDKISGDIAEELFRKINKGKKILRSSPKAAELAKLFANVYRYINFSLGNEFGLLAENYGEDGHEVVRLVNEGYKRGGLPIPGLTGGPCLSKDGYYLTSHIPFPDFIQVAWRLSESIPQHVVNRLRVRLEKYNKKLYNSKVAVLGLGFKANSDNTRYSPSVRLVEILKGANAEVAVHDPLVQGTQPLEEAVRDADAIILATNHSAFEGVHKKIAKISTHKKDCILVDCWGFFDREGAKSLGFDYIRFGSGK